MIVFDSRCGHDEGLAAITDALFWLIGSLKKSSAASRRVTRRLNLGQLRSQVCEFCFFASDLISQGLTALLGSGQQGSFEE